MTITSKLEISLSCTNLVCLDVVNKSNPQIILLIKESSQPKTGWREIGRTEVIWSNLNPSFNKLFFIEYNFGGKKWLFLAFSPSLLTKLTLVEQFLRFIVLDIDSLESNKIQNYELIGETIVNMGQIVASKGELSQKIVLPKNPNKTRGFIHVKSQEAQHFNDFVFMKISVSNIDKKRWLTKPNPFLVISRPNEQGKYQKIFKTEYHKGCLTCTWSPFSLSVEKLCGNDYQRPLRLEIYDYRGNGTHKFIGLVGGSLQDFLQKGDTPSYEIINPKKKTKNSNSYKNSGIMTVNNIKIEMVYSFYEYIKGGHDICLMVGIDFTESNGSPRIQSSLHYINPQKLILNDYQKVINYMGRVLKFYNTSNKYPVFGFGAKIPPTYQVSHCFPLSMDWNDPIVHGIEEIMEAYRSTLMSVILHGPTHFSSVINNVANYIKTVSKSSYHILLIIADGEMSDLDKTIEEIVEVSDLPLSIIIVGVGNSSFEKMKILCNPLECNGKKQSRATVQFVTFRQFQNTQQSLMAESLLKGIPGQFVSYMTSHKIRPLPPIQKERETISLSEYSITRDTLTGCGNSPVQSEFYVSTQENFVAFQPRQSLPNFQQDSLLQLEQPIQYQQSLPREQNYSIQGNTESQFYTTSQSCPSPRIRSFSLNYLKQVESFQCQEQYTTAVEPSNDLANNISPSAPSCSEQQDTNRNTNQVGFCEDLISLEYSELNMPNYRI